MDLTIAGINKRVDEINYKGSGYARLINSRYVVVALFFGMFAGHAVNALDHWYRQVFDTVVFPINITDIKGKQIGMIEFLNDVSAREQIKSVMHKVSGMTGAVREST